MRKYSLSALLLVAICKGALALPILQGTQSDPRGILGLTVGRNAFHATLSSLGDSYDSFYTTPPKTLISTHGEIVGDGPSPLMLAFYAALIELGIDGLGGFPTSYLDSPHAAFVFLFPTSLHDGASSGPSINTEYPPLKWACCGHYYGFLDSENLNQGNIGIGYPLFEFVFFTQTVVEPDTLLLLSFGLLAMPLLGIRTQLRAAANLQSNFPSNNCRHKDA